MNRRSFLKRLTGVVGVLNIGVFEQPPDHHDAKTRLERVAQTIEGTNLDDPANRTSLVYEIEDAVEVAEDGLNNNTTKARRMLWGKIYWVRQLLSGTSATKPQMLVDLEAIEAVLPFYETVANYLESSTNAYEGLNSNERLILGRMNNSSSTTVDQLRDVDKDTEAMGDLLSEWSATNTELDSVENDEMRQLTPERGDKIEEGWKLKRIYEDYADAQLNYVSASTAIETGAIRREQKRVGEAKRLFAEASSTASMDLSEEHFDYSLHTNALSLREYQRVLDALAEGASKMEKSCKSQDIASLNTLFSTGLERVFDSTEIIQSVR